MHKISIAFLFLSLVLWGAESRYESGLLSEANWPAGGATQSEKDSVSQFFAREFARFPEFEWRLLSRTQDDTHAHLVYGLHYRGVPVLEKRLKLHYNRKGFLQYASSNWDAVFTLEGVPPSERSLSQFKNQVWKSFSKEVKSRKGAARGERIVYWDSQNKKAFWAFDIRAISDKPLSVRRQILSSTGKVLVKKRVHREVDVTNYPSSPLAGGPQAATVSTSDAGKLLSTRFHVRRDENPDSPTYQDVPPADYSIEAAFSEDPAEYDYGCSGSATNCANQSFDAVNVYSQLTGYRNQVASYLSQLGAEVAFSYDPLPVIVNSLHIDLGDDGDGTDETNNAVYLGEPCASDGSMERCVLFFRPTAITGLTARTVCNVNSAQFYDLAREAIVVAHEYQHYITDTITGIAFSASTAISVGDALHEGYSDYLAASYVSGATGTTSSLIGAYGFQECSPVQRQLATLSVFDKDADYSGPHLPGLSWASAFWKLRTEFGQSVTDLLAVKSLFFLSTSPGFLDAIEAVVKADDALYSGAHSARIRTVFYQEAKFLGSLDGAFQDTQTGTVEVGLRGCGAVAPNGSDPRPLDLVLITVLWLLGTWSLGRRFSWRRS